MGGGREGFWKTWLPGLGTTWQVSLTAEDASLRMGHLGGCLKAAPPREGEMMGLLASLTRQKMCYCLKVQNKQSVGN